MYIRSVIVLVALLVSVYVNGGSIDETQQSNMVDFAVEPFHLSIIMAVQDDQEARRQAALPVADLSLALIGAIMTEKSSSALVDLMGVRLDGALSQAYTCYVLQRGVNILNLLQATKDADIHSACQANIGHVVKRFRLGEPLPIIATFCRSIDEIAVRKQEYLVALKEGDYCEDLW